MSSQIRFETERIDGRKKSFNRINAALVSLAMCYKKNHALREEIKLKILFKRKMGHPIKQNPISNKIKPLEIGKNSYISFIISHLTVKEVEEMKNLDIPRKAKYKFNSLENGVKK
uniref:Ribosomal protein S10 n=1 Tax=Romanomermis culicivorax TaxID=13658 RepID=A0A915HV31_ROMCU